MAAPASTAPQQPPPPVDEGDQVLDEALDEIFFNEALSDDLEDFVHEWDPNDEAAAVISSDSAPILDDSQLGVKPTYFFPSFPSAFWWRLVG